MAETPLQTNKLSSAISNLSSVINSQSLAPQKEMNLPEKPVTPETDAMGGALETVADDFVSGLAKDTEKAEAGAANALTDFVSELENRQGFEGFLTQSQQEEGVRPLEQELLDINSQLRREQMGLRRARERIQREGGGLKTGAAAEISNLERKSFAKQADLAIVQLAAQGRYDSARQFAEQKARAMFEQEENMLEARKFLYEENRDLFNKAEQREFQVALNDRERRLENERRDFETLQDTKLSAIQMAQLNGAPPSVLAAIQSAQTPEEVLDVGGQWGSVDMLERQYRRQQIATSRTNQLLSLAAAGDPDAIEELGFDPAEQPKELDATTKRKAEETYNATSDLLRMANEYKTLVDTKGITNTIFGESEVLGKIESLRGQMTAAYKDAKTLGTLDQGLLTLMDTILGDEPTSTFVVTSNITGRRSSKISSQMQELIEQTSIENARNAHLLGKDPWSNPLDLDLDQQNTQPTNTSTNPLGI